MGVMTWNLAGAVLGPLVILGSLPIVYKMMKSFEDVVGAIVGGALALLALALQKRWTKDDDDSKAANGVEAIAKFEGAEHACRLPKPTTAAEKKAIQADISLESRSPYFEMSRCPITASLEQRMEQVSTVVSKENYNDHWEAGTYSCARCGHALYASSAKFVGPCMWPSFRKSASSGSLHAVEVPRGSYNKYQCDVHELYCGACKLFLGHCFADGHETCDTHADAGDRHCVLSLSLRFSALRDTD